MDVTTQRRLLITLTVVLLLGGTGAIAWSLSAITPAEEVVAPAASGRVDSAPELGAQLPAVDEAVLAQKLRGPLYDPPPPPRPTTPAAPKPTPPVSKPKLEVTLVGTIIESKQSLAIVADATGKFDVKGVGQSLDLSPPGMTVQKIESEQVTLNFAGRNTTVALDRSRAKKAGGGNRGTNRRRNNR